jgi:hypothetical protein
VVAGERGRPATSTLESKDINPSLVEQRTEPLYQRNGRIG